MTLKHGLLIEVRRVGSPPAARGQCFELAPAYDVLCVVASATGLVVSESAGCTAVELGFSTTYPYALGKRPAIQLASGALKALAGVLIAGQQGSGAAGALAAGNLVWVRVKGVHPTTKINGGGGNIVTNDPLMGAADGKLIELTAAGSLVGVYVGADTLTTDTLGPVWLGDPLGLLAGL